jgi:hypothetical protein
MKKIYSLLCIGLMCCSIVQAQDEGALTKKSRIDKSSNIFIGGGPSFTLGKNIGDYSKGINLEAGFLKRVNRLLSIGPSISYMKFKYDPAKTQDIEEGRGVYYGYGDVDTEWYGSGYDGWNEKYGLDGIDYAYVLSLKGGELTMISLSVNLKLNLVPVRDNSVVSVYLFAKPFITSATRKAVTGTGVRYTYEAYEEFFYPGVEFDDELIPTNDDQWYPDGYVDNWGPDDGFDELKEKKMITGGVLLGPGIELFPAKTVSGFVQVAVGYTFPVSFVSTKAYDYTVESYLKDEFPMVKKGFPSLNVQFGVSFNF